MVEDSFTVFRADSVRILYLNYFSLFFPSPTTTDFKTLCFRDIWIPNMSISFVLSTFYIILKHKVKKLTVQMVIGVLCDKLCSIFCGLWTLNNVSFEDKHCFQKAKSLKISIFQSQILSPKCIFYIAQNGSN